LRRLEAGESFIVIHNDRPVGELTPLRRHHFVAAEKAAAMLRAAPTVVYERLRVDLDTVADQGAYLDGA
jgi:antitoxin (DNA-binding transcriptional repressor) of toxin-antitoxin stability system